MEFVNLESILDIHLVMRMGTDLYLHHKGMEWNWNFRAEFL